MITGTSRLDVVGELRIWMASYPRADERQRGSGCPTKVPSRQVLIRCWCTSIFKPRSPLRRTISCGCTSQKLTESHVKNDCGGWNELPSPRSSTRRRRHGELVLALAHDLVKTPEAQAAAPACTPRGWRPSERASHRRGGPRVGRQPILHATEVSPGSCTPMVRMSKEKEEDGGKAFALFPSA